MREGGNISARRPWSLVPGKVTRRGLWFLGIAALVIGAVILALPYIASTLIVRDRIALELSAWSGYRVTVGDQPEIRIWPDFVAVLSDVSMVPWDAPDGRPAISAERVEVELSPLAALRGNIVFSTARLVAPVVHAERTAAGHLLPNLPGGGRLARSVATARGIVAENRSSPETDRLPGDSFGIVEFSGGSIVAGDTAIVTGLSGRVEWPALNRPGYARAEGLWRDEEVTLDASSSNPLLLFGGGSAAVSVTLRSAPANFRFDGTATLAGSPYFEGQGKFLTPSLRRLLEWIEASPAGSVPAMSIGLESNVSGNAKRVRFEEATVILDDNPGRGALDLVRAEGVPVLSGTLAFGSLDLQSLLQAFTPPAVGLPGGSVVDADFVERVNLDLRLSASTATLDTITLSDVAATVQVNESFTAFDISDATAFGGNLQAGIRRQRKDGGEVELRVLASDVDGGAFGAAAGMTWLVPIGRGTVSIILSGPGSGWPSILEHADGSISANFGKGALSGLDLDSFLERAKKGGFFALGEVSDGTLPIDAAELKAVVEDGIARIERAEARSAEMRIELSGILSHGDRSLALSGRILPADPEGAPLQRFFVGGSWSTPFISPVAALPG